MLEIAARLDGRRGRQRRHGDAARPRDTDAGRSLRAAADVGRDGARFRSSRRRRRASHRLASVSQTPTAAGCACVRRAASGAGPAAYVRRRQQRAAVVSGAVGCARTRRARRRRSAAGAEPARAVARRSVLPVPELMSGDVDGTAQAPSAASPDAATLEERMLAGSTRPMRASPIPTRPRRAGRRPDRHGAQADPEAAGGSSAHAPGRARLSVPIGKAALRRGLFD